MSQRWTQNHQLNLTLQGEHLLIEVKKAQEKIYLRILGNLRRDRNALNLEMEVNEYLDRIKTLNITLSELPCLIGPTVYRCTLKSSQLSLGVPGKPCVPQPSPAIHLLVKKITTKWNQKIPASPAPNKNNFKSCVTRVVKDISIKEDDQWTILVLIKFWFIAELYK